MTKRKLIKEKSKMTLEKLGRLTQQGFLGVEGRLTRVEGRLTRVEGRLTRVEGRLIGVEGRLTKVENDVRWMKNNFSELFTKLDKFIALYEKQEQELLVLGVQLRRLEERVAALEKARR